MRLKRQHINKKEFQIAYLVFFMLGTTACETFVEIDPPKNTLITETVFNEASSTESAMSNIFVKMRQQGFVSGNFALSVSMGIYADELDYFGANPTILKFYNHNITPSDETLSGWWRHAYNIIYAANDIIEGIGKSNALNIEDQNRLKGQALFIRAYMHSLLVVLYGDIPYITTTDYQTNSKVARIPMDMVYEYIISDLNSAIGLLGNTNTGERILPNASVANALLARMYLYTENWALAETTATKLIALYNLEPDISKVFLKNSMETIWQLKTGNNPKNTYEALQLIIDVIPNQGSALTNDLINAFEPNDLRKTNWIGSITGNNGMTTLYYAHKYKATHNTTTESLEYPIVFRLSEQYLIRAEARVHNGDGIGAQQDINAIRNRAGLPNISIIDNIGLLEAIVQERRVELFVEQGHRWFDLKRLDLANSVLSPIKTGWKPSNLLLPVPENELALNANLKPQNEGY